LHIVVTHGTPLRMFSRLHGGRKKKVQFCGVTAVTIGEDIKMLCNCKHNHLKQKKNCVLF
jgi:hypothetical protein